MNRDLLSIYFATYSFIRKNYDVPSTLWESVRDELQCFKGLMPLAVASWTTPWSPVAYMVDASLTGYGIQSADLGSQIVGDIGRVKERSRWRLGAEQARARSLEAAGYALNEDGKLEKDEDGALIKLDPDLLEQIHRDRWAPSDQFPEIPAKCLRICGSVFNVGASFLKTPFII